jgi:hypothetical protein
MTSTELNYRETSIPLKKNLSYIRKYLQLIGSIRTVSPILVIWYQTAPGRGMLILTSMNTSSGRRPLPRGIN